MGLLLLLFFVASFAIGPLRSSQQPAQAPAQVQPAGKPIWVFSQQSTPLATRETSGGAQIETGGGGLAFTFNGEGRANVSFGPDLAPPFMAITFTSIAPDADGTLIWRVRSVGDKSIALRINAATEYVELIYEDATTGVTELLGNPVSVRGFKRGNPTEVAVLVRTPSYTLFVNGSPMLQTSDDRLDATSSTQSMSVTGTRGVIALFELRVHDAP